MRAYGCVGVCKGGDIPGRPLCALPPHALPPSYFQHTTSNPTSWTASVCMCVVMPAPLHLFVESPRFWHTL